MHVRQFILFFCMVFAGSSAPAQKNRLFSADSLKITLRFSHFPQQSKLHNNIIPGDFSTSHFGFVCRQEYFFEKNTKVKLRVRLGSVTASDRLEGKRVPLTLIQ
jgi:hypothetical protein